jgi:hypothetical protein
MMRFTDATWPLCYTVIGLGKEEIIAELVSPNGRKKGANDFPFFVLFVTSVACRALEEAQRVVERLYERWQELEAKRGP